MSGPRVFSRYETLGVLGEGAMGTVYKGRDPRLGRLVAIKSIKPEIVARDPSFSTRFQREARTVAALSHPNIVAVHDCEDDYIVMEFVEGRELKQVIQQRAFSGTELAGLVSQFAAALDYAHDRGVIHRDVKPANALVTADGRLKVTDFGIAKLENAGSSGITQTGQVLGTPAYMSPEQVAGKPLDRRSDQFSLAVVVYEMLTGKVPFPGDSIATIVYKIIAERHRPVREFNAALPEHIEAVMDRALAKDPAARYPTCTAFADALRGAISAEADPGRATLTFGLPAPVRPPPTRPPAAATVSATAIKPPADAAPTLGATRPLPPPGGGRLRTAGLVLACLALLALPAIFVLRRFSARPVPTAGAPSAPGSVADVPRSAVASAATGPAGESETRGAPPAPVSPEPGRAPVVPFVERPAERTPAGKPVPPPPTPAREPEPVTSPAAAPASEPAPATPDAGWSLLRQFQLAPKPGELTTATWNPSGDLIIGDRDEGRLRIYNAAGRQLTLLPADQPGRFRRLFQGRKGSAASDAQEQPLLPDLKRPVALARAGERLWISDPERKAVVLVDRATGEHQVFEGFGEPDLIAAGGPGAAVWDRDADSVILLDGTGRRLRTLAGASGLKSLAFLGGAVLAANSDGLWREQGGRLAQIPLSEAVIEKVGAVAVLPGGPVIADRERRALVFFQSGWKPAGRVELEPLKIEAPAAILARGDELWLIDEDGKISVLSKTP